MSTLQKIFTRLKSWEGFLLSILVVIVIINSTQSPAYLSLNNQINLFVLSIEKIILALVMTFIIINAEIDLSVASVMGLAACLIAVLYDSGVPMGWAILIALLAGAACGLFNGLWVAKAKLSSLVVTLSMMIAYRGVARILVEDRSIGNFPEWFDALGQKPFLGPLPLSMIIFFVLLVIAIIILQYSAFGRRVFVIGNSSDVARYSGVKVASVKLTLYIASGVIAALAGILFAARLGAVRGDMATGFELDVITMVLLGGVSIFGGSGSLFGVLISIMIILNLRNGMALSNLSGHMQTGVIGILLILSVLVPNLVNQLRAYLKRRQIAAAKAK
jgi:rhamnose transport system permease protein